MEDSRWPNKIYQCTPQGRRRRARPQESWKNQVTDYMRSRNLEEDTAEDRRLWPFGMDRGLLAIEILIINENCILCKNYFFKNGFT